MRWKEPLIYETRVVKKFLLFPKKINNETRWLEKAEIIQEYCGSYSKWVDYEWLDKKKVIG